MPQPRHPSRTQQEPPLRRDPSIGQGPAPATSRGPPRVLHTAPLCQKSPALMAAAGRTRRARRAAGARTQAGITSPANPTPIDKGSPGKTDHATGRLKCRRVWNLAPFKRNDSVILHEKSTRRMFEVRLSCVASSSLPCHANFFNVNRSYNFTSWARVNDTPRVVRQELPV